MENSNTIDYQYLSSEAFTISNFLTQQRCIELIGRAEDVGYEEAPINSARGVVMRKDIRNNSRVILDDETLAAEMYERLVPYLPVRLGASRACGLNERFRFYKYEAGQQFDWHCDGAYQRANGEKSRLTVLFYLNEGFVGGETAFQDLSVAPETGLVLVFQHQLLHKGMSVQRGVKLVMRSDVMYEYVS